MIIPPFGRDRRRKPRHTNIQAAAYSDDSRARKLRKPACMVMQAVRQLLEP